MVSGPLCERAVAHSDVSGFAGELARCDGCRCSVVTEDRCWACL